MKSQQTKKRLKREEAKRKAAQKAREENPHLMALFLAFIPAYTRSHTPKYSTDKYGNRVLTETLKDVKV